ARGGCGSFGLHEVVAAGWAGRGLASWSVLLKPNPGRHRTCLAMVLCSSTTPINLSARSARASTLAGANLHRQLVHAAVIAGDKTSTTQAQLPSRPTTDRTTPCAGHWIRGRVRASSLAEPCRKNRPDEKQGIS